MSADRWLVVVDRHFTDYAEITEYDNESEAKAAFDAGWLRNEPGGQYAVRAYLTRIVRQATIESDY